MRTVTTETEEHYFYLQERRHVHFPAHLEIEEQESKDYTSLLAWRMTDRMKTVSVALVLCLNIGTDPPDIVKTFPCARKECWIDPFSLSSQKALEVIGKTLQNQYERWQPRARYRQLLDPTVEDSKKLASFLRRNAKQDRVLWHYNGHGVPRPTPNGEIWVFNKNYTQYIPLSVYDLQAWVGQPAIYVFDCSAAGILLSHFNSNSATSSSSSSSTIDPLGQVNPNSRNNKSLNNSQAIVLAACGSHEVLPMNPQFSADLFTSCLTTPITVALRWFISQNAMSMGHLDPNFIDRIPGKLTDRKTPLGELNWIFTAITDTIAWNCLPRALFQTLFRQDLLVASLFRNFLLAERIMTYVKCTPCSIPALPPTHHHSLWQAWDLAAEGCLSQLSKILNPHPGVDIVFQHSPFFAEQLTAFEICLQSCAYAPMSSTKTAWGTDEVPEQLPIVLQVLLSQVHRLRALVLLRQFLDLGPWAVNLALSVGIFPYVLKLLQSPAMELRQVLVFIWAKILALDQSCQVDLIKDNGHLYFLKYLVIPGSDGSSSSRGGPSSGRSTSASIIPSAQKVMAALILATLCEHYRPAQVACFHENVHFTCCQLLVDPNPYLRRWLCFALANLWEDYEAVKLVALRDYLYEHLLARVREDSVVEVRAAAVFALGKLIGMSPDFQLFTTNRPYPYTSSQSAGQVHLLYERAQADIRIAVELMKCSNDASALVRTEILFAIAKLMFHPHHYQTFVKLALDPQSSSNDVEAERERMGKLQTLIGPDAPDCVRIWEHLVQVQSNDFFPTVAQTAATLVDQIQLMGLAENQERLESGPATGTSTLESSSSPFPENHVEVESSSELRTPPLSSSSIGMLQSKQSINHSSFGNLTILSSASSSHPVPVASSSSVPPTTRNQPPDIPKHLLSSFYAWSKNEFNANKTPNHDAPTLRNSKSRMDQLDPLTESGAAYHCRLRRHQKVKRSAGILDRHRMKARAMSSSSRSRRILRKTKEEEEESHYTTTMHQTVILDNEAEMTSMLLFHPYEPMLVVADNKSGISVWDYDEGERLCSFSNQNTLGSRLTSFQWINRINESLLCCGSDDGGIRIWHGIQRAHDSDAEGRTMRHWNEHSKDSVHSKDSSAALSQSRINIRLVSAFEAVPDLTPGTRGSGLVTSWNQRKYIIASEDISYSDIFRYSALHQKIPHIQIYSNIFIPRYSDIQLCIR